MDQDSVEGLWQSPRGAEPTIVWLDDGERPSSHRSSASRRTLAVVAAVVCVTIVGVPVGLVLTSARSAKAPVHKLVSGPAKRQVLAALSATIDSGSWDFTYSEQPVTTATSPTPTTSCSSSSLQSGGAPSGWVACSPSASNQGLAISGQGTIDTNPFAMVAESNVPGLGPITLRDNGTDVWEIGGGNYGLSPGSSNAGPGSPLSGFAGSVEGTIGARQGALAMKGLASPTGYLELEQNAITSASQVGTGVVDGVAVTIYQVRLDPAQEANVAGTTPDEATAIHDALGVLQNQGYSGTTVKVSIDGAGFIRATESVASFTDGATQTVDVTLSNFGCAGKVLMPGQTGSSSPPSGCVSPDTAKPAS